ncbi:unnamed protein product [Rotaria sordida]|uniref:CCDC22 N-terminal domain-containing protein n=1 Tax=Rotaria sordida TaxID=392033 RepID=A0A814IH61_9BILA|nr:unnamed protein product [Rotaria sordida]CAF1555634.1 unnamed protein product [Rotaria sordida]
MEEVGRILIQSLRDIELPTRLPPNISTRFKVCGELAQLCQSYGYKDSSSYVFEQVDLKNFSDLLMYENQVSCWLEKQREASYLIPAQLITHKLSKDICQQIEEGDTTDANYEYTNCGDIKKEK